MSFPPALTDPARLGSLHGTGLLDTAPEKEFDRITDLAARSLGVPVCLISLVDANRQFFKSATGLPSPWCELRETPLSHSFCQQAVESRQMLKIEDSLTDPRVTGNLAIRDLGVRAYLGFPLIGEDGQPWGAFCVIDGTPRRWTTEEEQTVQDFAALAAQQIELRRSANRLRSLLEVMAHDLKNPLASVRMISGLLHERRETLPRPCQPLVESLTGDSQRAIDLINSIVKRATHSRDFHGGEISPICLATHYQDTQARFRTALDAKQMTLAISVSPEGAAMEVDQWAFTRILDNLLSNAIKFSAPGTVIDLRAEISPSRVMIEITDRGPGFTEEDLAHLYSRYSRLSARPTNGEDSTGLGLSLVKSLVEHCNAQIECLSKVGEGTTFRLAFPAC